ncbi:MAG: glycosyltransferase [Nitriliruptorales bacterium]|nr:glycosyltransferase [Nitriliruptorales bacterium]
MRERFGPPLWAWSAAWSVLPRVRDDPLRVLRWGSARLPSAWAERLWALALTLSEWPLWRRQRTAVWVLRALALDALGQRSLLSDLVAEVEVSGSVRARHWTGKACLAADPALAMRLAAGLPPGPERVELEGRALAAAGALGQAAAVLARAAARYPDARRVSGWRARVEGEMRLLDPNWQPRIAGAWRRVGAPVPGRALHLVTNALPFTQAGYTIRSQRLARAQQAAGLDPHLVTRPGFPLLAGHLPASRSQQVMGVPAHWLLGPPAVPVSPDAILQHHVDAAWALADRLRPAVLHPASDHRNARVALALRERLAVPVVYEVRGFLEETRRTRQPDGAAEPDVYHRSRAAETACMCRADHVVTLGEAMRDEIVTRGVPAERVTVIPNAADDTFLGHLPDVRVLRDRLGATPGDVLIGSVSTLNAYEGLDDLVRALALLTRRRLPARLLLVGDGPSRCGLERLAEQLGVRDRIAFTGRVPHAEVLGYHAAIDVFAAPRTAARVCHLVTPLKPVEAMAAGRAVVVSRLPALTELVRHGVTGLTVDPEHPGALAEALGGLCEDADLRRELGRNARAWTVEHRTWRGNGQRYRALYAALGVALPPRLE